MALAGPRSSKKLGALAKWVDDNQADIVYSQEKRKARKAIIEAIDAEEKDKGKGKAESAKKEPVDDESGVDSGEESGVDDSELCDSESEVDFDNESDDEIRERAIKRRRERKIAQKLKEWEDNNARNYVLWHRVQKEVHGELRIRASRESASVAGDNHVDVQFDRYLRVSKLLEMKDWIHKDLPSLPMEARVLHHKAQKRVLELEETVTRLLQDVGYAADISMGASPTPAPFRRDLPQSGTHQARTSTPRRTGKSDTIHMKRKALMTIPQKIADVDSNSEESDEEEMVTEEKKREAHEEVVTEERKGESHEEDVTKCDACIQTEPETQTRITSEAAVQTCINAEALTAGCTAIHVKSDGNCVAYCLQAIELGGRVDGDFERWQRGLCQSVKAKYWSKKNFTERSLTDPDSGYYNSNAIRVWARKQKRNILVVQSYDGYNGMQGISAILYLFDGTTMLAPDADLWGLTDNFAIVIEGDPAHATLYQKKCEVVEIE
ncbi:hypothetical protein J8273_5861 [Carpediemonas membranifera]|uniref:Uncharacterized protein n=1 Tax=Carpediemonas membranifera TaxID=201153 RepID=A0A8J6E358_9EUKA|nr:hypothetical protein J8273_5861 [Carpediemonas membranifera]|eukprot:KAG9392722.1 hypothetical protein J8273_5861 [Carpediemonas membranifera]